MYDESEFDGGSGIYCMDDDVFELGGEECNEEE